MIVETSRKPTFGIYQQSYKKMGCDVVTGVVNNKRIDIYTKYKQDFGGNVNNQIEMKLYYISDLAGNWLKSKLKYYSGKSHYDVIV